MSSRPAVYCHENMRLRVCGYTYNLFRATYLLILTRKYRTEILTSLVTNFVRQK